MENILRFINFEFDFLIRIEFALLTKTFMMIVAKVLQSD